MKYLNTVSCQLAHLTCQEGNWLLGNIGHHPPVPIESPVITENDRKYTRISHPRSPLLVKIKQRTGLEMGKLIPFLKEKDRETILANVLIMAHNPDDEAGRMVAT